MRSTHNTIRAWALGLGLTLLVVTGTAAMMAAFSASPPATDIYRRIAITPSVEPATHMATGHDSVLYERVVLPDGQVQWVLTEAPRTSTFALGSLANSSERAATMINNTSPVYPGAVNTVSYTLVVKPVGLSKAIRNCSRAAYHAYDLACNTMS